MTEDFHPLVRGTAEGRAQVLDEPLSLWGGLDPETGAVIDAHHPQRGTILSGRVLVMPFGRGSSSSASTFLEAVRCKTNPAAIVLAETDDILVLAAIVARTLYGITVPVVVVSRAAYDSIRTADGLQLGENSLTVSRDGQTLMSLKASR